jgi:hypothetical protein
MIVSRPYRGGLAHVRERRRRHYRRSATAMEYVLRRFGSPLRRNREARRAARGDISPRLGTKFMLERCRPNFGYGRGIEQTKDTLP